jgi:hypothetical protein
MWFVILKALLPEGPLYFRKFQVQWVSAAGNAARRG